MHRWLSRDFQLLEFVKKTTIWCKKVGILKSHNRRKPSCTTVYSWATILYYLKGFFCMQKKKKSCYYYRVLLLTRYLSSWTQGFVVYSRIWLRKKCNRKIPPELRTEYQMKLFFTVWRVWGEEGNSWRKSFSRPRSYESEFA